MKRTLQELVVCCEFSCPPFFYVLPRHSVVGWPLVSTPVKNRFFGIWPLYGFNRKPFTHFGITSLEREPTWYVSFRLLIIQNRLVHRNRSFLGIVTIFVWNTNTVFSTTNIFYFWCRCRSTKVIVCLCFCSSAHIARNRLSSNSSKLFLADSFWLFPV